MSFYAACRAIADSSDVLAIVLNFWVTYYLHVQLESIREMAFWIIMQTSALCINCPENNFSLTSETEKKSK